jgi:hypothetical protein
MASVIHHIAIKIATAAAFHASGLMPPGAGISKASARKAIPPMIDMYLVFLMVFKSYQ